MKKRHGKPSGASYDGIFVASHLTDEALLRSIDGELSPSHAKDVLRHVQSCWACRSRKQALEDCIADLVTHHNALAAPYLPPSSGGRAILLAGLDAATAGIERPAPRMGRLTAAFLDLMRGYRLAHLAAILLLVTGLVVTYFMRTPPVVSAGELLDRTAAYEARSLQGTEEPVIIQQLRVTIGPESIVHTVYHDVARNRDATRDEGINPEQASLQKAYARSSLAWNSPLDIESFRRWRADHLPSRESVSRVGSNQLLLTTTFASGPVREANLTIHIPDYHAVREGFRLQDNSNIQIAELSRVVIPFAQLSRSIFAPDEIAPAPRTLPRATPAAQPHAFFKAVPTAAELSKTEVQAERLLHTLGADLGEQINLSASSNHNVLVTGVVRDTERKQQLSAALHDLPYLRVELSSVDEAKAAATAPEPSPSQPVVSVPMVLTSSPPLLERELSSHFPDRDQRIAYVNQTLTIVQLASSRAWALKRLADRHPASTIAVLDDASRDDLKILLADHISALREDLRILQNQLLQFLPISSSAPMHDSSAALGPPAAPDEWRVQVARIHSSTETVREAIAVLLTNSQPGDRADAKAITVALEASMAQLQLDLQALDTQVGKEILN